MPRSQYDEEIYNLLQHMVNLVHALSAFNKFRHKKNTWHFSTSLIQNNKSADVLESTFCAIQHFHKINLCNHPFRTDLCEMIVEAAKRCSKPRKKKKEPLAVHHLQQIYEKVGKELCSLLDLRTFTMMVVSFADFLRYNEIADLEKKRC